MANEGAAEYTQGLMFPPGEPALWPLCYHPRQAALMVLKLNRRRFISAAATASAAVIGAPMIIKAAASDAWGDLVGRFEYDGAAPERKRLTVDKDVDCCGKFDIRDETLMVGEDRGLMNTFVYVRSRGVTISPATVTILITSFDPRSLPCTRSASSKLSTTTILPSR